MSKSYYIGVSTTLHDPSLAIIDEKGEVLFAEATERFLQLKIGVGCNADPIIWVEKILTKYCNPDATFCISETWSNKHKKSVRLISRLLGYSVQKKGVLPNIIGTLFSPILGTKETYWASKLQIASTTHSSQSIEKVIRTKFNNDKVKRINFNHHDTHVALACYSSPFKEALCLVMDGTGEKGCFSYYKYSKGTITKLGQNKGNESLGGFYILITKLCGFDPTKGEEWKVMGLSAYGKKDDFLYEKLRSIYQIQDLKIKWKFSHIKTKSLISEIEEYINSSEEKNMRQNVAYTGQLIFTEYLNCFLNKIYELKISDNLIYTGGCALNSLYNGKITSETPFKRVHIPSAPGDDGNSIGAAYLAYKKNNPRFEKNQKTYSPYLGSIIDKKQIESFIKYSKFKNYKCLKDEVLLEEIAKKIAKGKIIGWVQGAAEFGPRALGNRSILADPRDPEMKDKINSTIKFREDFRPFAPSILEEFGNDYFENYQPSYYMERALKFRNEVIEKIPAVVHKDFTGRLQTVSKVLNPKYYNLITAFYKETGIPILLNTSLNVMGKPIVNNFSNAMDVFLNSGMDVLVVNNYVFEKNN